MTEIKHGVDESFNDRLNILRAVVLGANDGIISIAGVRIGVASATKHLDHFPIWFIGDSWQVPFRWQAVSMSLFPTIKRHGRSCCEPRTSLVGSRSKVSKRISTTLIFKMENAKLPQRF